MLNVTRARNLRGIEFKTFVEDFLKKSANINGISLPDLPVFNEIISKFLPLFTDIRDDALDGKISTANYSLSATSFMHSLLYSYLFVREDPNGFDAGPTNGLAYTPLVNPYVANVDAGSQVTGNGERLDYYADFFNQKRDFFINRLFDVSVNKPSSKFVQRALRTVLDDLILGDVIFKDRSTGYNQGHPLTVLRVDRDNKFKLAGDYPVGISDMNLDGRMIAEVYNINNRDTFDKIFQVGPFTTFGILRTIFSDNDYELNRVHYSSVMRLADIPDPIMKGNPKFFPDFSQIEEFSNLWKLFSNPSKRNQAVKKIVEMLGMHVLLEDGRLDWGPRWKELSGSFYWICNYYSTFVMNALGITDIGHWYTGDKPTRNRGKEFRTSDMYAWFNRKGREYGWIDVTHATEDQRRALLKQGYVLFISTSEHTSTVLPSETEYGEFIPVMSQAGYNWPWRNPNASYKFIRPRSHLDVKQKPKNGIVWAHILPEVTEPENPYRARLFGHNVPDVSGPNENAINGWLTNIKDLETAVGGVIPSGLRKFVNEVTVSHTEKLPTGNHIFRFAFDVVQTIQQYKLPLGVSSDQDPELFIKYLIKTLTEKGYGKIVTSKYAESVFKNNIKRRFVTREMSLENKTAFIPLECFGLVQLLDMAREKVDWAPARAGGLVQGDAQQIAEYLINQLNGNSEVIIDIKLKERAIGFDKHVPNNLDKFKAGDTFYIKYGKGSTGHTGVILTDPFIDAIGRKVIAVADSNRVTNIENGSLSVKSDGMPRIRIMDYDAFMTEFMKNEHLEINGKLVILRSDSAK
jgi:hypothetical protein